MKKSVFLTLVGIFVVIATIIVLSGIVNDTEQSPVASEVPTPTLSSTASDSAALAAGYLPKVTLTVPETPGNPKITLTNSTGVYNQDGYQAWITMLPDFYATRQTRIGYDLFGIYAVNYGGSGVFYYVGLFQYLDGTVTQQGAELLGSQLHMTSMEIQNDPLGAAEYEVVISFLELGPNQANAEVPNTPATRVFQVKDHKFLPQ